MQPTRPDPSYNVHMSKGPIIFGVRLYDTVAWDMFVFAVGGLAKKSSAIFVGGTIVLYIPARAYIVGQSFRMVFYLPPDAFQATQWKEFFPHFA
jgi:hypothetical protein